MNDTPLTDAAEYDTGLRSGDFAPHDKHMVVAADFARRLERKLNAAQINAAPHDIGVSRVGLDTPQIASETSSPAGAAPDQCPHGVPYRWNCETCDAKPAQEVDIVERLRDVFGLCGEDRQTRLEAADTIEAMRRQVAELSARIGEMNMHQQLQDSTTAAVLERAEKAEAERDALREDAERYRWLRKQKQWPDDDWLLDPIQLDAAVDVARKK